MTASEPGHREAVAERGSVPSSADSLRAMRFSLPERILGRAMTIGNKLVGNDRYDDYRVERVCGLPFIVTPGVFNPKVLRTGEFFASQIDSSLIDRNDEVLDMGTGSGVCAVFAANHARRVIAVDINAAAVRCAGINALMNHLEHKIEVRHGDLFAAVPGERFDLILFNPPFLRGAPRDDRDRAWRSSDVAERFAAGLGAHLKLGGAVLMLLSTFGNGRIFLEELHKQNFEISVLTERRFVNERLTIFRIVHSNSTGKT
jgi:release factor glutamine methyltransferase